MSLILYPSDETTFDSNGIGILADATDSEVYEELNGQCELTVQYPVTGSHFSEIVSDAYITAKTNPVSDPQPFRIYRITKPMKGIVTIYARHNAYRLSKIVAAPFTALSVSGALQTIKANAVSACPFDFWTDKTSEAQMSSPVPKDIWTLLGGSEGSVLDTYGGEYEFDKFTVKLHTRRGADRGVSIRYGKNLTDLKQDESIANVFTGVYPYWVDTEGNLVQLPEKYINGPGTYAEDKIKPLDLSQEFDVQPTVEQLRTRAEQYIANNDIGKPDITWTVEFVQLEQTEEYKGKALLERVLLGDTVSVVFPMLNVDVSSRAVAARYKPLLGRYKSITLGKVKANLAKTIVRQEQEIQKKPSFTQLEQARVAATEWLTNGKGYVVQVKDEAGNCKETLYMDTPDVNTAVNVMKLSASGIGFSHSGVNGPYVSAWTIDGTFNADMVLAGTLFGILIKACRIESINGKVSIDLSDETATAKFDTGISTNGLTVRADEAGAKNLFSVDATSSGDGQHYARIRFWGADGTMLHDTREVFDSDLADVVGVRSRWMGRINGLELWASAGENFTGVSLRRGGTTIVQLGLSSDGEATLNFGTTGGLTYDEQTGKTGLWISKINGYAVEWKQNDNGTLSLIGTL
ncbi:MAG: phage tail protein [Oscillospiraceae bacterium]|nr:phage tail protein [Oscillospiraceae bacterium]